MQQLNDDEIGKMLSAAIAPEAMQPRRSQIWPTSQSRVGDEPGRHNSATLPVRKDADEHTTVVVGIGEYTFERLQPANLVKQGSSLRCAD